MTDVKIILAGTLLASTSEPELRNRLIRINGDLVESVEPMPEAPPETPAGALVIDARDKVVMPGLALGAVAPPVERPPTPVAPPPPNANTHPELGLRKGL